MALSEKDQLAVWKHVSTETTWISDRLWELASEARQTGNNKELAGLLRDLERTVQLRATAIERLTQLENGGKDVGCDG